MVLVCNRPDLAVQLLDRWHPAVAPAAPSASPPCARGGSMPADPATLAGWAPYCQARDSVLALA
jgi:beta-N-acetylhexosaminidase